MLSLKFLLLVVPGAFLISSCSTYKESACPDFGNNRNYSKKYQADYGIKKIGLHQSPVIKPQYFNLPAIQTKKEESTEFTIDLNKTRDIEYPCTGPIPNIPAINIQAEKNMYHER